MAQRNQLSNEKSQKDELVDDLLKKERKLAREMKKAQEDAVALSKKIEEIIKKEIEEAKRLAALNAKKNAGSTVDMKLSSKFVENKGRLPSPVDEGTITRQFGKYPHPVYGSKVMINNTGVDIRTKEKSPVRAIFDGEVRAVSFSPIYQNVVLIKHGDYFTVYSKLNTVDVKTGDKVVSGQAIGTVYTDAEKSTTEVHFEVWQGTNKLNPALWIYAQ